MASRGRLPPARLSTSTAPSQSVGAAGSTAAEATYHGYHALDSHIMGFTLWELSHELDRSDIEDLAATFMRDFPVDDYPYLAEHVQQHVKGFGRNGEGAFEFVLDLILDGLDPARAAA